MDILKMKAIQHTGKAPVTIKGITYTMDTFAILLDDNGTDKLTIVACKPEYKDGVEKVFMRRVFPLGYDQKTAEELTGEEVALVIEGEKKENDQA